MSKKNRVTTQGWGGEGEEEEVGTLLLGNVKNNVIVNYLFIKLSKGLTKIMNKLQREKVININFLLEDADSLKISVFYLF